MSSSVYDVIILGSGPAGLTAAIYASRDNLKTLVIGGRKWGGQLQLTTQVDNYPGFAEGILGPDLMEAMKKQAERFGAEVKLVEAVKVDFSGKPFKIFSDEGDRGSGGYEGKTVIIATGADTVWLGLPNEQRLIGHGVSSCAPCDAFFFKGKKVVVVGGGDSAMEEALVLSKFATEVTIVHRRDAFRASKIMQDRVLSLSNVKVIYNAIVKDVLGGDKVEAVLLESTDSTSSNRYPLTADHLDVDGVFIAVGHAPNSKLFTGQLELDEKGYVKKMSNEQLTMSNKFSNEQMKQWSNGYQMATSVPGVFVAGDVHDYHYKQAVTAAAFGCMAAMEASRWLSSQ